MNKKIYIIAAIVVGVLVLAFILYKAFVNKQDNSLSIDVNLPKEAPTTKSSPYDYE